MNAHFGPEWLRTDMWDGDKLDCFFLKWKSDKDIRSQGWVTEHAQADHYCSFVGCEQSYLGKQGWNNQGPKVPPRVVTSLPSSRRTSAAGAGGNLGF